MTAYREPGTIDRTEIERAKIHEAAETKRTLIAERERTKRARVEEYGLAVPFAVIAVAFLACAAVVCVTSSYFRAKAPCVEEAALITYGGEAMRCAGGHIETEVLPDRHVLWKCRCPADGGGAP